MRPSRLGGWARMVRMLTGMGDVHVSLSGLGRTQGIVAAVLTDSVRGTWVYHGPGQNRAESTGDVTGPLGLRPGSDRSALDLFFAPYRDETGATLTLRLISQDGKMTVARFAGGACDPGTSRSAAGRRQGRRQARRRPWGAGEPVRHGIACPRNLQADSPAGAREAGDAHRGRQGDAALLASARGCSLDDGDQDPLGSYDLERLRRPVRGTDPVGPGSQLRTGGHRHDRQSRPGDETTTRRAWS